ncbi:hypothetical protein AOQ84DRAFT_48804 [Glonium stellatum]|uniref:PHD-type domain-containing protein n=1 Tax=Glonium stellatum TaxID=574774 RepID=A0A8E2F0S3_9PEZI|nr:hypothetical protein AOQ84DRAFT_48804 [Glonium stellatum]
MSNISELLNPAPRAKRQPPSRNPSSDGYTPTTTYEAADALTTLATTGSNASYSATHDHYPPSQYADTRHQSGFGSVATPVEPSPPTEQSQPLSPTLDQYHHGSKSPEELRRQSMMSRNSPAPVLAPIQSLSNFLNERIGEELQQDTTAYSRDISQIVHPAGQNDEGEHRALGGTQNREPTFGLEPSPVPLIKSEQTGTPREATPSTTALHTEENNSNPDGPMDTETLKTVEALKKNDLGLRAKSRETATPAAETLKPTAAQSKKRPAPKSTAAANKKGTAAKKPATKKRKLDPETSSVGGTPGVRRSATPSSRASKTPALSTVAKSQAKRSSQAGTPVAGSSPAPDRSSQAPASDAEDSDGSNEDDDAIFCICRKPDNHRWMIACDGGCEDWFHGSCVDMRQEDENLIDKYICPNCEANGKGCTTWKPMCRREGCRQPARLIKGGPVSKYCSDQCGVLFFKNAVGRTSKKKQENSALGKRVRRKANKENETDEDFDIDDEDEGEPSPRGGVLRARDLKSLATAAKDIDSFRRLGSGVLSPPATASPTKASFSESQKMVNGVFHPEVNGDTSISSIPLNPAETAHLAALNVEKTSLQSRLALLKDREKFVSLTREQAARYAEREKLKPKEVCGYDQRLSWSEAEFAHWRASKFGKAALRKGTLEPTAEDIAAEEGPEMEIVDGPVENQTASASTLCTKKRCDRHRQWQKLNLQDARFEEVEVIESIRRVEREEKEVRERAMLRARAEAAAKKIEGMNAAGGEGWVEVVET